MRKAGGLMVTGVVVGMFAVGCGSSSASSDPYGGTPDFANIQQEFKAPTGTFAGHETATFNAYAQQQQNSSNLSGFSLGGGASGQSFVNYRLRSLGITPMSDGASCNVLASGSGDTGSCACPGGGSIQYDISGLKDYANAEAKGGKIDATIKMSANACKSADGTESVDGKIFENFRGTVPAAGTATDPTTADFAIIFDAHVTAVSPSATAKVDLDFELTTINGVYSEYYLVHIDDGTVVVSGTWDANSKTGSLTITDKNGSWTCSSNDGKTATCTGTGGSKTVTL